MSTVASTTRRRPAVLLDSGATVECRPQHLVQFAVMGAAYARVALGCAVPRVGLLSVGAEESKGNELTREVFRVLKDTGLNFTGNAEGRDIYNGNADVVVASYALAEISPARYALLFVESSQPRPVSS